MSILDGDIVLHRKEICDGEDRDVVLIPGSPWSFLREGPYKVIVDEEVHVS